MVPLYAVRVSDLGPGGLSVSNAAPVVTMRRGDPA